MDKKEHCSICDKLFEDIDKERIRRSVSLLREEHPSFTRQALCRLVIEREATFCGIVGGFTGSLPWPWLILGVAPDMITLLVKQSQMILSIACIYDCEPDSRERILEILGCLGASAGAVAGTYGIRKLVEQSAAKAVTDMLFRKILRSMAARISPRIVPIIGATAGIAFNQASVWSVGKIAMEYYKYYKVPSHPHPAPEGLEEQTEEESSEEEMKSPDREPEEEEMEDGSAPGDEEKPEANDDENGEHGSLDNVLTDDEVRELLEGRKTGIEEPQNNKTEVAAEGEKEKAEMDSGDKDSQEIPDEHTKKKITRIELCGDEKPEKSEDDRLNS